MLDPQQPTGLRQADVRRIYGVTDYLLPGGRAMFHLIISKHGAIGTGNAGSILGKGTNGGTGLGKGRKPVVLFYHME